MNRRGRSNEPGTDARSATYTCGALYDLDWGAQPGACPVQVSLGKITVILREPARGAIQLDTGRRGKGGRFSTGTDDLQVAIGVAEKWLKERQEDLLADGELDRVRPDTITVDQAMTILERHRPPDEEPRRLTEFQFIANVARAIWGSDRRISTIDQLAVERYAHTRTEEGVTFPPSIDHRAIPAVRPVTAMADLEIVGKELDRLTRLRNREGEPYLSHSPLSDISWRGSGEEYKKKRRMSHTHEAFRRLMTPVVTAGGILLPAPVDRVDPSGLLRFLVALAYTSARRAGAMRPLLWESILLTESAIRRRLISSGDPHRADWAPLFAEQGAIWWPGDTDKQDYERVFPMPRFLRSELDHYLSRNGRESLPEPHLPVFPSPDRPESPIGKSTLTKTRNPEKNGHLKAGGWLTEAILLAREDLIREGSDPNVCFPVRLNDKGLERFEFAPLHGFRSLWATTMRDLGWGSIQTVGNELHLDQHVSFLGSWSIKTGKAKNDRYVRLDPEFLLAIVEMRPAAEVLRERSPRVAEQIHSGLTRIANGRMTGNGGPE